MAGETEYAEGVNYMNQYLSFIAITALMLGLIVNDVEDHLQFHFGQGLTSGLNHNSYWYPDGDRKYEDSGDFQQTEPLVRRTIFGRSGWKPLDYVQQVPAWYYDGWHLMKLIRQILFGLVMWAFSNLYRKKKANLGHDLIGFILAYGLAVYVLHASFFDGVFK